MSITYCPFLFDSDHDPKNCEACKGHDLVAVSDR